MRIKLVYWDEYYYENIFGDRFNRDYKSKIMIYLFAIKYNWSQKAVDSALGK